MKPDAAPTLFQFIVRVPQAMADAVSDWLATAALAVTIDLDEGDTCRVSGIFNTRPDDVALRQQLTALVPDVAHNAVFDWQQLPQIDWLAATARSGAGAVGGFLLQSKPTVGTALLTQRALYLQSDHAFGDGFHATTHGCLAMLHALKKSHAVRHYTDIGCGTGVLALAARKLWPAARGRVSDVDMAAVTLMRRNARFNGGGLKLQVIRAAGLNPGPNHGQLRRERLADLVMANILAGPLVRLAPAVRRHAKAGALVILSGLLASQRNMVLAAYRQQCMRLVKSNERHGWVTLLLRK